MGSFCEIFKCAGVDEAVDPATMVVPFGGVNYVALDDGGQNLRVEPLHDPRVTMEELDPSSATIRGFIATRNAAHNALAQPGVDPALRTAMSPDTFFGGLRYFKFSGKSLIERPGVLVEVYRDRRGHKSEKWASLRLYVVDKRQVKLAIRQVYVRDARGNVGLHSKALSDPNTLVAEMNAVWIPQTNIAFDLISTDPVTLDGLGERVDADKFEESFKKATDPKANFTLFLVRGITDSEGSPSGHCVAKYGYALVADSRGPTTCAHEAGHFLGRGEAGGLPHTSETGQEEMLMRKGGAGWKITAQLTMAHFRPFFDSQTGAKH